MTMLQKIYRMNSNRGFENKLNGNLFEMKVLAKEKKTALFAVRTAGSKSPFDVIAFRKDCIRLISCKINNYHTQEELKKLDKVMSKLPKNCICYIASKVGKDIHYEKIS
jgi:hypothetical protein